MKKIFLDANVLVDLIEDRQLEVTGVSNVKKLFPNTKLCISALSVHIAFYTLHIKPKTKKIERVNRLLKYLKILPLTDTIVRPATKQNFHDFEDILQYFTAIYEDCDYILTRDKKDFSKISKLIPSKTKIIHHISQIK